MERWIEALTRAHGFRQQMDPWAGEFTPGGDGYSPAMLVMLDFVTRMWGVRRVGDTLEWGLLPHTGMFSSGDAEVRHEKSVSELAIGGRVVLRVEGACRLVTDLGGKPLRITGAASELTEVRIDVGPSIMVAPDEIVIWGRS